MGWASGVKARVLDGGEIEAIKGRYRKVGMAAGESPLPARIRPDDPFDVETHRGRTLDRLHAVGRTAVDRPVVRIDVVLEGTAVIPQVVVTHPNFIRDDGSLGETGFRYRFRHKDDPAKTLHLTILAFDVPRPPAEE